jgi:uncharacterized coiled-coil protein SlyX
VESHSGKKRRRITGVALSTAVLLVVNAPVYSQETEIEALRAQIEELTARLGKLEQQQLDTSDATKKTPPITTRSGIGVNVSGTLQVQANLFNNENGATFPRQQDTFRLRRAEIRITAPNITSRVSGTVQIDFAKFVTNSSSSPFAVNASSNVLQEIQLSYLLRKATAPSQNNIYVDLGQFKLPIGYEGDLVSSGALPLIERALLFRARDVNGGGNGDVRDTGIQLRGTQGQFDYRLGIFNGLGERQNAQAQGDPKAIVARLLYRPKGIDGLQLGASFGRGNTRVAPTTSGGATTRFDREIYNAFAVYKKDKWTFQGEYVTGKGQNLTATGAAGRERDFQGYYAHAGYLFSPKIEGVLRYDTFNFDRNISDAAVKEISAGLNYFIKGNNAKIQANIVRVQGGRGLTSANGFGSGSQGQGFQNDRTELRLQGQVGF